MQILVEHPARQEVFETEDDLPRHILPCERGTAGVLPQSCQGVRRGIASLGKEHGQAFRGKFHAEDPVRMVEAWVGLHLRIRQRHLTPLIHGQVGTRKGKGLKEALGHLELTLKR